MITDYQIIGAGDAGELTSRVKAYIRAGWQPLGSFVVDDLEDEPYKQAMVKYAPEITVSGPQVAPSELING